MPVKREIKQNRLEILKKMQRNLRAVYHEKTKAANITCTSQRTLTDMEKNLKSQLFNKHFSFVYVMI